ncbi:hypothetical protein ACXN5S_09415 [Pseudoroseicyclus sp. H15]
MSRMTRVNRFWVQSDYRARFLDYLSQMARELRDCPSAFNVRLLEGCDGEMALIYEHVGPDGAADCARFLDGRLPPEERRALLMSLKVEQEVTSYRPIPGVFG